MDRQISTSEKKKALRKQIIRYSAIGAGVIGVFIFLGSYLKGSLSLSEYATGEVDRGSIEITVNASGKLTPLIEEIIVSPINSRILEVFKNPGETVKAGEPLLRLELSTLESEYKQSLDKKAILASELMQAEVTLSNKISELEMQKQIKEMQVSQYYSDLQSEKYLDSIGASTVDKVKKAELAYGEAKLELEQLDRKIENDRKLAKAEMQVKELEISVFEKTLAASERLMKDASVLAPQDATLTFINNEIGAQVSEGVKLATISDLSSFKVNAEIADGHAEKLSLGGKAIVELGTIKLNGTIVNITPSSENGVINFTVVLDDATHSGLRSGLRTDVNVLYGLRQDVMRIPYGDFYKKYGRGEYDLWVLKEGKAEKRKVTLGESSFEYIEVISGLNEGEKIILAELDSYKHKETIKIK